MDVHPVLVHYMRRRGMTDWGIGTLLRACAEAYGGSDKRRHTQTALTLAMIRLRSSRIDVPNVYSDGNGLIVRIELAPGISWSGDEILIDETLPDTVVTAAPGMALSSIMQHDDLPPDLIIGGAANSNKGTKITIAQRPVDWSLVANAREMDMTLASLLWTIQSRRLACQAKANRGPTPGGIATGVATGAALYVLMAVLTVVTDWHLAHAAAMAGMAIVAVGAAVLTCCLMATRPDEQLSKRLDAYENDLIGAACGFG